MKHILLTLGLLAAATCNLAAARLAESGSSAYAIVVAPDAIPAERTAARELQELLREITGAELPLAARSDGPAIYVGQSPAALAAFGLDAWDELAPDEILLKTVGDDLFIAGDRPRGSLYAVYELLENEFGVRFWTAEASTVPKRSVAELPAVDYRYAPPFQVRAAGYDLARRDPRFAARTRNNGHGVYNPPEWGDHIALLGEVHTFCENSPLITQEDIARHPEWMAEIDGKRSTNFRSQLCLTNPELRQTLTERVLARLAANPETRYISVSQNDSQSYCRCAECSAFVEEYGNQSDLLLFAVNEVAEKAAERFPGVYIETLGYQYTRTPPETFRAAPNVIVRYCTIEGDFARPLTGEANRPLYDDLEGWRRAADQLMIWDYVTNFLKYYLPQPNWAVLAPNIRLFRDCGTISIYEQGSWNGGGQLADLGDLRAWVTSRLLWNPDLDADRLIDEFLNGFYGPAAPYVRRYIDNAVLAIGRHPETALTCYMRSTSDWFDEDLLIDAWSGMAEAVERFGDDPVYGERVKIAAVPVYAALAERHDLLGLPPEERLPELRRIDPLELVDATAAFMALSGVTSLSEGGMTPGEWRQNNALKYAFLTGGVANDGPRPAAAGDRDDYLAVTVDRVAELHALDRGVFLEADPAAVTGRAVRMPNTHNEWHIQSYNCPPGKYELYCEVRCDSAEPSGDAIRIGTYNWNQRREFQRDFPAAAIAGDGYTAVKVGEVELDDATCIFIAPVINPAVENVWIDRLILIPVR